MLPKLDSLYENSKPILEWQDDNRPDEDLIYKSGVAHQVRALFAVKDVVYFRNAFTDVKVVSSHSSKSVPLPVSMLKLIGGYGFIRDNFHDIKLSIVSKYNINLPYHLLHQEWSAEKYEAEKKRAFDYQSKPPVSSRFNIEDYSSDAWFSDWSGDTILRHEGRIYRAYTVNKVYCEGINSAAIGLPYEVFHVYEKNRKMFTVSCGTYAKLGVLMDEIQGSMQHSFYEERDN